MAKEVEAAQNTEEDIIILNLELIESKKKMDKYAVSMTMSEGTPTQMEIGVGTLYILRELTDHHKVCIELGTNVGAENTEVA